MSGRNLISIKNTKIISTLPINNFFISLVCIFFHYQRISIMWSIGILIISFIVAIYSCLKFKTKGLKIWQQPFFWVLLSLVIIFLISPLVIFLSTTPLPIMFAGQNWEYFESASFILAAVAVSSYAFGFCVYKKPKKAKLETAWYTRNLMLIAIIIVSFILYFIWSRSQGGLGVTLSTRGKQSLDGVQTNVGYLRDAPLMGIGALIGDICIKVAGRKRNKNLIFNYIFILILIFPYIINGSRSYFIYILLVLLISLGLTKSKEESGVLNQNRKVKIGSMIIGITLIPILIVAPRLYRGDQAISLDSVKQTYAPEQILMTATGGDTTMLPAFAILQSEIGNSIPYLHGSSYINALGKPIPRKLWQQKPLEFDTFLNYKIFPSTYQFFGVSFSALSEPYVNFGVIGISLFFVFLGYLNKKNSESLNLKDARSIYVYSWLVGFMFILIRGNLTTDYHRLLFPLVVGLLVFGKKSRN